VGKAGDRHYFSVAGLAFEDGNGGFPDVQHFAEEIDKLFVGFSSDGRGGDLNVQDIIFEPGDFIASGARGNFYLESNIAIRHTHIIELPRL
jgi:hypothetical protein